MKSIHLGYTLAIVAGIFLFGLFSMQEGRIGIEVVNQSQKSVESRLWQDGKALTLPVTVKPGRRVRLALQTQPWEFYVRFTDAYSGQSLGRQRIRREDEIDGTSVVTYAQDSKRLDLR